MRNSKITSELSRSTLRLLILASVAAGSSHSVLAATGFGARKAPHAPATVAAPTAFAPAPTATSTSAATEAPPETPTETPTETPVARAPAAPAADRAQTVATQVTRSTALPPPGDNAEWMRVSFDQAENEVMALFQRDLAKIEELSKELAVYEARTTGKLPADYRRNLRTKLERVLLTSKNISVKQCLACEEARVYRDERGDVKYESYSSDRGRPAKVAAELGVAHLLYTELSYTPEDLQLRVRLVDGPTGRLLWAREYSTADVIKTRDSLRDADSGEIGHGDSLGRVIIGEVAFTAVLSPGVGMLPTVDQGNGSSLATYPSVDLFLGEKFDRGRKVFGFLIGGVFNMGGEGGGGASSGKPLAWALRVAPRFRYVFNPYNVTTARYSIASELGAFIGSGVTTGYIGIGPEMAMVKRFSISLTPIYILSGNVAQSEVFNQGDNGSFSSGGSSDAGKFGGPGILMKASINW